jgi:xanthosine utilization system XapX-like protein
MVGGRAVRIGKRIVKWIFSLLNRYPSTVAAALVMAALAYIAAHIPVLRYVLLPIVQGVAVVLVGLIFCLESVRGVDVVVANK